MPDEKSFREKLETLINEHSMEAGSNTPDFILAEFLADSLRAFDKATTARALWYGSGGSGASSAEVPAGARVSPHPQAVHG